MTLLRSGKTIFCGKTGTAGDGFETSTLGWFIGSVSHPQVIISLPPASPAARVLPADLPAKLLGPFSAR